VKVPPRLLERAGWALGTSALALHATPALAALAPVNRRIPTLSGRGRSDHVALTFDDGPDPFGTPPILDLLADLGVTATFFMLGRSVQRCPSVAARVAQAGHEIALHGFSHELHLRHSPRWVRRDLAKGLSVVEEATGRRPRWYRPPYGVFSSGTVGALGPLRLQPLLWTTWGRDWLASSSGTAVAVETARRLRPGGTILLHDSDCTSAPGSWRATLDSLAGIVALVRSLELEIGPVREHFR
jgi:peptidoglycan/xylan/chitin deacetylase (PgdA/CDA1 family)